MQGEKNDICEVFACLCISQGMYLELACAGAALSLVYHPSSKQWIITMEDSQCPHRSCIFVDKLLKVKLLSKGM